MFFSQPFTFEPDSVHRRVLALFSDRHSGEIRIQLFLDALLARGIIEDYLVVGRDLKPMTPRKSFGFTHIWCQRNISTAQFRFLKRNPRVPFVYDVDDLL